MSERFHQHSNEWVMFSYASFISSVAIVAVGIFLLPVEFWVRAFLFIGMAMLVQSSINVAKTVRDNFESDKLISRIDDAKTEQLLLELNDRMTARQAPANKASA